MTSIDTHIIENMPVLISSNMLEVYVAGNEFGVTRYVVGGGFSDAWEEFITDLPESYVCEHDSWQDAEECDCETDANGRCINTMYLWMREITDLDDEYQIRETDSIVDLFMMHTRDGDESRNRPNGTPESESDTYTQRHTRITLSSNHNSHDQQVADVIDYLRGQVPEDDFDNLFRTYPEVERIEWQGAWFDTEAMGVDVEFSSWLTDHIEDNTDVYWEDGEPWLVVPCDEPEPGNGLRSQMPSHI